MTQNAHSSDPESAEADQPRANELPVDPGLTAHLGALANALRNWLSDHLGLILLDGQLAGVSLVRMLVYGVVAALLFMSAWLLLMVALAFALNRLGLDVDLIALIIAVLCLIAGGLLVQRITHLSGNVTFQATRAQLRSEQENLDPSGGIPKSDEGNPRS